MQVLISLVLPAFNEEHRIAATLDALADYRASRPFDLEVIAVDDGSTDNTFAVLEDARDRIPDLVIAQHTTNHGKGRAVATGMLLGTGEYRAFFDADGATPFGALDDLVAAAAGAPGTVAIGSLRVRGTNVTQRQPWLRTVVGRAGNAVIRAAVLPGVRDSQRGCKLFPADAAELVFAAQQTDGWGFDIEVLARARKLGFDIAEVPVEWRHVDGGQIRVGAYANTLREVARIRSLMRDVDATPLPSARPSAPLVAVARKPA